MNKIKIIKHQLVQRLILNKVMEILILHILIHFLIKKIYLTSKTLIIINNIFRIMIKMKIMRTFIKKFKIKIKQIVIKFLKIMGKTNLIKAYLLLDQVYIINFFN